MIIETVQDLKDLKVLLLGREEKAEDYEWLVECYVRLNNVNKIEAIKILRDNTNLGLSSAKDLCDRMYAAMCEGD